MGRIGKLDDKVAIITGAASGVGRAGAELFAGEGAKVVAVDVTADALNDVVAGIRKAGGEAVAAVADVSRLADVQRMVDDTVRLWGRIDILWNNAAIIRSLYNAAEEISEEDWNAVISVNLTGTFFGVKCVVPHMKKQQKGVIINTASIAGMVAHRVGRAAYVASKGGIIALTRQLALELGNDNIRVNAIAPGSVNTGMGRRVPRPDKVTFEYKRVDLSVDALRVAEPIEIARTALFLAGDDVGPLTGIILPHDGGKSSR